RALARRGSRADRPLASAVVAPALRPLGPDAARARGRRSRRAHRVVRGAGVTRVSLRAKLILAQVPLLVALIIVGAVGSFAARELGHGAAGILSDNFRSVLAAQRMAEELARIDSAALFCVAGERARGLRVVSESR